MSKVASSSLVGRTIDGRYRVHQHIADGGMGSVFVATDERLDREVALKVMRPDLAKDDDFVARFRREARSAARLSHPHVVAVFDQGQDDDYVFLAMELVRGRTLRQVIRSDAPLTPRAALDIFEPMLMALSAAHRAGIVHRDVKPENVLLSEEGQVKVADFGLARAVTTETVTNNSDILLGTAAYLSPEQVEHGRADIRSDVYSAGLLLHEMLTGVKAFPGDSPIHVAYQHVHGPVPQPSQTIDTVPAELDALVGLAAAKDPDARPDDAADLLTQVRRSRSMLSDEELDGQPHRTGDEPAPTSTSDEQPGTRTMALGGPSATTALRRPPDPSGRPPGPPGRAPRGAPGGPGRPGGRPGTASAARPSARRPSTKASGWIGMLLVLALVLAGTGWWFFLGPGSKVTVPNVVGQPQGRAVQLVSDSGLDVTVQEVWSENVPQGRVISSSPRAGGEESRSGAVRLRVSRGPQRFTVPQAVGRPVDQVRKTITDASLRVGPVTQAFDETVPQGQVISVTPSTGTRLKKGTAVSLVVSKGRQPIAVPSVVGRTQAEATGAIDGAGLKTQVMPDREHSDTVPAGSVVSQSPMSGTLFRDGQVSITLSKGPEMVTVPSVVDKNTGEARRALEAAGLQVKVSRFFGGLLDTVRDQDPKAGTSVRKGSTVTISVV